MECLLPQGRVRHKRVIDLSIAVYACCDRICSHIRLEEGEEGCASVLRCSMHMRYVSRMFDSLKVETHVVMKTFLQKMENLKFGVTSFWRFKI